MTWKEKFRELCLEYDGYLANSTYGDCNYTDGVIDGLYRAITIMGQDEYDIREDEWFEQE